MASPDKDHEIDLDEYPYKDFDDEEVRKYPLPALVLDSSISGEEVLEAVRFLFKYQIVRENFHILVEVLCSLAYSELRSSGDLSQTVFGLLFSNDLKLDWSRDYIVESETEKVFNLKCFGSASQSTSGDDHAFEREREAMRRVEEEYESLGGNQRDDVLEVMADRTSLSIEERAYIGGWAFSHIVMCITRKKRQAKFWAARKSLYKWMKELLDPIDEDSLVGLEDLRFDDETYDQLCATMNRGGNRHCIGVVIRSFIIYNSLQRRGSARESSTRKTLNILRFPSLLYARMAMYRGVFAVAQLTGESPLTILQKLKVEGLTDVSINRLEDFLRKYAREGFFSRSGGYMIHHHARSRFLPIARLIDQSYVSTIRSFVSVPLVVALSVIETKLNPSTSWREFKVDDSSPDGKAQQLGLDFVAEERRRSRDTQSTTRYAPGRHGLSLRGTTTQYRH